MSYPQTKKFPNVVKSWIAFDAGNSAFATTVLAAFFPLFFANYWGGDLDSVSSSKYFSAAVSIMNICVVIGMPIIGAMTDIKKLTKSLFAFLTLVSIFMVSCFYFIDYGKWQTALVVYGISFFCFCGSVTLYDKMLLSISSKDNISKISGYGYSFGYLGGGLLFLLNSFMVLQPSFFGLAGEANAIKWSFVTVSLWWLMFLIPLIIFYRDPDIQNEKDIKYVFSELKETIKIIISNRNIGIFLLAFFLYIDGVHTVMSLASMFANGIGINQSSIIQALILVQFVAFPATLFWAYISNKFNDKIVIYITIFIYLIVVFYSMFLSSAFEFFIMAGMIGSVQGGIQASSRSFFGKIIPVEKSGEFFGFYNTFGRAGTILGPAMVAVFLNLFNNLQIALIPIIILFIIGGILMYFVNEAYEDSV